MNHRKPPLPESWNDERGICRWCGCCIIGQRGPNKGKPLYRRRWHQKCADEYTFIFWPDETKRVLIKERGRRCEDCGSDRHYPEAHHIIPLIDYPHDPADPYAAWRRDNLVLLCHACHVGPTGRHAKLREEARQEVEREAMMADPQMRLFP